MNTLLNDSMAILQQIHFLRTDWFFAFIPLFIYTFLYFTKTSDSKNWQSIVDPQLQNFVLEKTGGKRRVYPIFLIFIATSLCITALAGPVYKKLPQPVYQEQSALVVLLDLSQSMNATDVKPTRLARAKLELLDILKTRKSGQTAFIVYAADAFTVTPLTNDNATIANLIPSLETSMMPAQGSNLSKGLTKAFSLLTQAGIIHGNILVISDDIHSRHETAIKKLVSQGHRLSIFGIGTNEGSPVPISGGFLLNKQGAIVIPKLHPEKLQNFAFTGGGLYTGLTAGDKDTLKLTKLFQSKETSKTALNNSDNNINADIWQEEGYWLLLPLLLFAALWARKGWIAIVVFFILPIPQPVYAQQTYAIDTDNLWSSEDQKAMRAFNKGEIAEAAKQFNNQEWKASALYKNGDYQAAADALKDSDTSDGYYNKGNALAKLGSYEAAIKAYDEAIKLDAKNSDAEYNRGQVKKALKKQQDSSQSNENNDSSNKEEDEDKSKSDKSDSEKQQSQDKDSKQQDGENKEPEDSESDDDTSKEEKPGNKDNEDKQNEEELKKRNAEQETKKQQEEQEQYKQDQKDSKQEQTENDIESEDEKTPEEIEINPEETSISEAEKATKQWLKRIPDDPGGLLKRKFLYQYNQLPNQTDEQEPW